MNEISKKITDLMDAQNVSYGELAAITGIPKSALFRYAKGQTGKMPLPRLEAVAKALNVDPAYLIGWEDGQAGFGLTYTAEDPDTKAKHETLLNLFDKLSEEAQEIIILQLRAIAQSQTNQDDH